jgi:hypothetical protein
MVHDEDRSAKSKSSIQSVAVTQFTYQGDVLSLNACNNTDMILDQRIAYQ